MTKPITIERWNQAQEAERKLHKMTFQDGMNHYSQSYSNNFRFLDIDKNLPKLDIIEIGCADFPALRYCNLSNIHDCIIIEPMPSECLKQFCDDEGINLIVKPFEQVSTFHILEMEIWMFNVLQHTVDPEMFIALTKKAKCVKYFEPINTEITEYHPHSFSFHDFERWFPRVNEYYNESNNPCFHDGPCCYGVWENKEVC